MNAAAPSTINAGTTSILGKLLEDEVFRPSAPTTWKDIGLSSSLVESLILKYLATVGADSGRGIAKKLCLPYTLMEQVYSSLRTRQLIVHNGSAPLGD